MQMYMLHFLVKRYFNILKPTYYTHIHICTYYYVYRTVLSMSIILIGIGMYTIIND